MKHPLVFLVALLFAPLVAPLVARSELVEVRPALVERNSHVGIEYRSGETLVARSAETAPGGVALKIPGGEWAPVNFYTRTEREGVIELGPAKEGALTLRWRLVQKTPSLIERTLEVTADSAQQFTVSFPLDLAVAGEFSSFTGPVTSRTLIGTERSRPKRETFPVVMLRSADRLFGLIAESPGLWENRCDLLVEPSPIGRIAIMTGDGSAPYPITIKKQIPGQGGEDARDHYQYQMDGWQSLAAGETRRYTTWVFASSARSRYDEQLAAHVALANGKGWNSSAVEAILRNTSYYLLRRNLMLDENNRPRDGRTIFISGISYGWKQWVSDGFYAALGLDDPEMTIESNRAIFGNRMGYEDNSQYYLIWAALMKRAGGTVNDALVNEAYTFIRLHEKDHLYIPPPLPGAPNPKGWKTYHDVLLYDEGDSPVSNQGFHCGAFLAAKELGLPVTEEDIERAITAYRGMFNREGGYFPTSIQQPQFLAQDTLYGATLTFAVFGRKLLTDEQVLTHYRTSEKVKSPYGLRVISQADGSLRPGDTGRYCYGGSWFLNDSANYLLAGVHGLPEAEVDTRLIERIGIELVHSPAFNEDIDTVNGKPHGNILYSWNSGFWWLRKEIRRRLGHSGIDPVGAAIDAKLGVVREKGMLRLEPKPRTISDNGATPWIGYTELQTDLPGGRHANIRTMRATLVAADGTARRRIAEELADGPEAWTQFAGWSPDGKQAIVSRGWQDPANGRWEDEHKTFRMEPGKWMLDTCLVDLASGRVNNVTAVERVSHYNSGLFFLPDGRGLGFTPLLNGISKPFLMDLDGRNKRDVSGQGTGFTYGYSASPDGQLISYHEDYQLYLAKADGSEKRPIKTGHPFNFAPRWSPDGEWLLFVSGEHYNCHPHVVRRDGTGLKKLADRGGYRGVVEFLDVADFHGGSSDLPAWSADGKSVFYTAKVGENVEIFQVALAGEPTQLTTTPAGTLHYHATPSPDGGHLLYGSKRGGVRQLVVMNFADHTEKQLTDLKPGQGALWPHWQPVR